MSATDHLSHQLFHGTIETLKPGDVIKSDGGVSWATENLGYALKHTEERTRTGFGVKPGGEYPVHHGNIYAVEPLGQLQESNEPHNKGAYMSKDGFRVKEQVASVLGPEEDRKTIKKNFTKFDPSKESYVENGRYRFSD
jgi:hypothetical protein